MDIFTAFLGFLLILSFLGVITAKKPVHAALFFLLSLLLLATLYLLLSASFVATMQVLVYAGAILVIFIFVIILFQDAHSQIEGFRSKTSFALVLTALSAFFLSLLGIALHLDQTRSSPSLPPDYGTVQSLGKTLYLDFFFPFEAVVVLFLLAIVGSVYIAKKD